MQTVCAQENLEEESATFVKGQELTRHSEQTYSIKVQNDLNSLQRIQCSVFLNGFIIMFSLFHLFIQTHLSFLNVFFPSLYFSQLKRLQLSSCVKLHEVYIPQFPLHHAGFSG